MINIFIDTNIFLNFYHFSNEDLESLKNLGRLIDVEKVRIHLPDQVQFEFKRNREAKIQDAFKRLRANDVKAEIPQLCADFPESKELKQAALVFREKKKVLLNKITDEIKTNSLKADEVIKELFAKIGVLKVNEDVISRAKRRYEIGNPPGKKGSLGDAINWECLLDSVYDFDDIYFISGDSDYVSELDENEFSNLLKDEWKEIKYSEIIFFKSLNQFFKEKFPDIEMIAEDSKEAKIKALEESPNFDAARSRLEELYKINEFSDDQINRIVLASVSNNQIYWAHEYSPELIGAKLEKIVEGHEDNIDYNVYKNFCRYFNLEPKFRLEDLL